jgi:hypothetical protein
MSSIAVGDVDRPHDLGVHQRVLVGNRSPNLRAMCTRHEGEEDAAFTHLRDDRQLSHLRSLPAVPTSPP